MLKSEIMQSQKQYSDITEALTLCWITNYAKFCQLEKLSRWKSNYDNFFHGGHLKYKSDIKC